MKRLFISLLGVSIGILFITSCASRNPAEAGPAQNVYAAPDDDQNGPGAPESSMDWPVTFTSGGLTYSIYQPQCDSWNGHDFAGRSAVAVQSPGQSQAAFGTVNLTAITLVDKNTGTIKLADIKVASADFPSARAQNQSYLAALRGLPQRVPSLSLDQVEASLTFNPPAHTQRLINTPPKIITDNRPAILVSVDGPVVWRPVSGTSLQRAINTRVLLLKDASDRYYLHLFDGYLQANSLESRHWTVTKNIPDGAALAQEQAIDEGNVDLMRGTPDVVTHTEPSLDRSAIPDVFVSTAPAELITFSGEPNFVPIPGTDLLYVNNTSGNVFKLLTDQQNYVLLSGRWYRASSLNGPWQFVPGNQLPHDFAVIPDDSPKENVKASVPGTPQAREALIANSIPQSSAVPLNQEMQKPQIDGAPQLAPIQGTPLNYVVNSATPIIEVGPQSWYACEDGVWYFSPSVSGPWTVATSVPSVIYTIPTSSTLHYVTYVQVYGSAPDDVYEGYTPGYLGTEVAGDDTVVYGTGYDYQPWVGSDWYSPPMTWGYGFAPSWTPWFGWGFNCGFGWGCGYPGYGWWLCNPPFPFWGGYRGWHGFGHRGWGREDREGFANTGVNFYHRDQLSSAGFRSQFGMDRFGRGIGGQFGRSYNSRTGQLAAGQWAGVQNVRGSAWNPIFRGGFVDRSVFPGVARPGMAAPAWNSGYDRSAHNYYYAPRTYGNFGYRYAPGSTREWQGGGTRSGGSFHGGGGGWFHGGGSSFRGGGEGGGFHGGGGGFHGGRGR